MYLEIDDYDKNFYKLSSDDRRTRKNIEDIFQVKSENDKEFMISKKLSFDEFMEMIFDVCEVTAKFNYRDINNFFGNDLLMKFFEISYDKVSSEFVRLASDEIYSKLNKLKKTDYSYVDLVFTDTFFFDILLDELEDNVRRTSTRFNKFRDFRRSRRNDRGRGSILEDLAKLLFVINFATEMSKTYVYFVLSDFYEQIKKEYRTSGTSEDTELVKTLIDYIDLKNTKDKLDTYGSDRSRKLIKTLPISSLDVISYGDIAKLLDLEEKVKDQDKSRKHLLKDFIKISAYPF